MKKLKQILRQKVPLLGGTVVLLILLAINAECIRLIWAMSQSHKEIEVSYQTQAKLDAVQAAVALAEQSQYQRAASPNDAKVRERVTQAENTLKQSFEELLSLNENEPLQKAQINRLQTAAEAMLSKPLLTAQSSVGENLAKAPRTEAAAILETKFAEAKRGELSLQQQREAQWQMVHQMALVVIPLACVMQLTLIFYGLRYFTRKTQAMRRTLNERAQLMDSLGDGVYGIDSDGICTFINQAASSMLGYKPGELLGAATHPLIHHSKPDGTPNPAEESPILQVARSTAQNPQGSQNSHNPQGARNRGSIGAETFWRKDWKAFPVEYSCQPLTNADGEHSGAVVAFRDVTEQRQIESELQGARDSALQSTQLKSEFLANMSHEIRTPMNAILGMAGLLEETRLDELQRDFTRTIMQSADALLMLINDILDFSKGEAGKLSFEQIDFELPVVIESVLDLVSASASNRQLAVNCTVDSNVPQFVRGDPGRLRQVLTNLLSNAIKFTSEGGVTLRIQRGKPAKGGKDAGTWLNFAVKDTGIGIDPDTQKKLFKPFTQADGSTTRRFGGTGLGLAICKQIIEQMGDATGEPGALAPDILIESTVGVGSTFTFEIFFPQAICEQRPKLKGKTVLVVDDSPTNQRILQDLMEPTEATLLSAVNGLQALLMRPQRPLDLAILDMEMTQMDALQLARALKDAHSGVKLLMLTTLEASNPKLASLSLPVVHRPIVPRHFFQQVTELIPPPPPEFTTSAIPISVPDVRPNPPAASRNLRILLAEDNATNQKVALHQLKRLGHHAYAVSNGLEVLELTQKVDYDVILMDCQMPEMDGYEATRKLRERENQDLWNEQRRHTWVIALTAHSLSGDREKCLAAGMDDYLSKPAKLEAIQDALNRSNGGQQAVATAAAAAAPAPVTQSPPAPWDDTPAFPDRAGSPATAKPSANAPRGHVQPEALAEIQRLDASLLDVITATFECDVPPCLTEIRSLTDTSVLSADNAAAISRAAHKIKGGAGNFGANHLQNLCVDIQRFADQGRLDEIRLLLHELEWEFSAVVAALHRYARENQV